MIEIELNGEKKNITSGLHVGQLLDELGVRGDPSESQRAAEAYDRHPNALFFLGRLLADQYGGDIARNTGLRGDVS